MMSVIRTTTERSSLRNAVVEIAQSSWLGGACFVLVSLVAILAGSPGQHDRWALWAIQSLFAVSLVIVWGTCGIFSLGQGAMFGMGAYASAVMTINLGRDAAWSLPLGMLAGAVVGMAFAAIVGAFIFHGNVGPIDVAVITLGSTLVLAAIANNTADPRYAIGEAKIGGFNGMVGIPKPTLAGVQLGKTAFFIFVLLVLALGLKSASWLGRRNFGRVSVAVRLSERRAELLGYDVRRHQWRVFTLGGAIAGLSGALFASWGRFVTPGVFSLSTAVSLVIWVLVGSRGRVSGAVVGVVVVQGLTSQLGGSQGQFAPVYLGAGLILIVLLLPNGLVDALGGWVSSLGHGLGRGNEGVDHAGPDVELLSQVLGHTSADLRSINVSKHFGGVHAVNGVDAAFSGPGATCVIGPNGAGKSTFLALLAGLNRPTKGQIILDEVDVSGGKVSERVAAGIGLKMQSASAFGELSVMDNVEIAAAQTSSRESVECATLILSALGLQHLALRPASSLSHGEQQWLDIAMVLALRPSVVLLDEPAAGLTQDEADATAELIRSICRFVHVVVIDHNMSFIRSLAAPVIVMHLGSVLASGSFEDVENNDEVLEIYLGGGSHAGD